MNAQSIFLGSLFTMLVCNLLVFSNNPTAYLNGLYDNGIISALLLILVVVVIAGINVLGSGLTGASVKIIFSVCAMLLLLFEVNVSLIPQSTPINNPITDASNQIVLGLQSGANAIVSLLTNGGKPIQVASPTQLNIGFGFLTRIYNIFLFGGDLFNIGLILTGVLGIMFIGSALILIVNSGGGGD